MTLSEGCAETAQTSARSTASTKKSVCLEQPFAPLVLGCDIIINDKDSLRQQS